jgi:putative FmdB family regulatory protein
MPIYAYRCGECGHATDVLQKLSDPLLTTCPACGAEAFTKQVTAAGFQLKGSGWYATDFKGSGAAPAAPAKDAEGKPASADQAAAAPAADKSAASPNAAPSAASTAAASATQSSSGAPAAAGT